MAGVVDVLKSDIKDIREAFKSIRQRHKEFRKSKFGRR